MDIKIVDYISIYSLTFVFKKYFIIPAVDGGDI